MRVNAFTAIAPTLALASCAGLAGVRRPEQHRVAPRGAIAWRPPRQYETRNGRPRIDNDVIRHRIRVAIESALTARAPFCTRCRRRAAHCALLHRPAGPPALIASTLRRRAAALRAAGAAASLGAAGACGAPTDVRTVNYHDSAMMLDLTERASGQPAWRAISQRRVDEEDASQESITATVADMVQSLP